MIRWKELLLLVAIVALGALILRLFFMREGVTPEMQRADTVLVADPALRDSLEAKAESIKVYMDSTKLVKKQARAWKDTALTALEVADSMRATLSSVVQDSGSAIESRNEIIRHLRFIVIPTMQRVWHLDSITIARQDSTIEQQRVLYNQAIIRGDKAIKALEDLRSSIKPPLSIKIPLVGRVPVKDIALTLGAYCLGGGTPC